MRLQLKNVGKIKSADVEINGITVVAGENNTGKSTVGKMLFCLFHAFCDIDNKVRNERIANATRAIALFVDEFMPEVRNNPKTFSGIRRLAEDLVASEELDLGAIKRKLDEFISFCEADLVQGLGNRPREGADDVVAKIINMLQIPDEDIRTLTLQRHLGAEFGGQVSNVNTEDTACVRLKIKNKEISFESNGSVKILSYINLIKKIVYIDNPFILDSLARYSRPYNVRAYEHTNSLLNMLNTIENADFDIINEIEAKRKTQKILDEINKVSDGNLKKEDGHWSYTSAKFKKALEVQNLSTGIKSFAIIKTLLQNGMLEENGIMFLDEPEIHLHPEWQLKYAEIIVLLHKEFGINVLLNTHSPYFLNAIEVYSAKHSIVENCRYYLTDDVGDSAVFEDVTGNIERIYERLAAPLQALEDMENE